MIKIIGKVCSKPQRFKVMHILMIIMCLIGSFVLYQNVSILTRIIIGIIISAYASIIFYNPSIIKRVFISDVFENQQSYYGAHQIQLSQRKKKDDDLISFAKQNDKNNKSLIRSRYDNILRGGSIYNDKDQTQKSPNKLNRSFEADLSMTAMRAITTSQLGSKSHIFQKNRNYPEFNSQSKFQRRRVENQGNDIQQLFKRDNKDSSFDSSRSTANEGNNYYIKPFREQALSKNKDLRGNLLKKYLEQLKKLKLVRSEVIQGHKRLKRYIYQIVNPLIIQQEKNLKQIQLMASQLLNITFIQQRQDQKQQFNIQTYRNVSGMQRFESLRIFIFKCYLFYFGLSKANDLEACLKKDRTLAVLKARINEIMKTRIKLDTDLGFNFSSINLSNIEFIKKVVRDRQIRVNFIKQFVQQCQNNAFETGEQQFENGNFKQSVYLLFIFIKELNKDLKNAPKIKFADQLGFEQAQHQKYSHEIFLQIGFDFQAPHYNIRSVDHSQAQLRDCEPGPNNYLSAAYFMLFNILNNKDIMRWNINIAHLVNQIIRH